MSGCHPMYDDGTEVSLTTLDQDDSLILVVAVKQSGLDGEISDATVLLGLWDSTLKLTGEQGISSEGSAVGSQDSRVGSAFEFIHEVMDRTTSVCIPRGSV